MKIYSVYDKKAQVFSNPIFQKNDEVAIRDFSIACSDPHSLLNRASVDFDLRRIGEFDESSGLLTSDDIVMIATAEEVISALEGEKNV